MNGPPASPVSMSLSRLTFSGKERSINKTLAALSVLSLISMLLGSLAVLLIMQLSYRQDNPPSPEASATRIGGSEWTQRFLDSAVILASLCVMLCLCSVVSCTTQCYFASKMLKLPQGEERAHRFLSDTSATRFLAISSFFTAIPVFLAALCVYLVHEFRLVPAAVSTSFLGLGLIFMIATFGRSVWLWRREQDQIIRGVGLFEYNGMSAINSVDDGRAPFTISKNTNATIEVTSQSDGTNLSTLV